MNPKQHHEHAETGGFTMATKVVAPIQEFWNPDGTKRKEANDNDSACNVSEPSSRGNSRSTSRTREFAGEDSVDPQDLAEMMESRTGEYVQRDEILVETPYSNSVESIFDNAANISAAPQNPMYPGNPTLPWHTCWVDDGMVGGSSLPIDRVHFRALADEGVTLIVNLTEQPVTGKRTMNRNVPGNSRMNGAIPTLLTSNLMARDAAAGAPKSPLESRHISIPMSSPSAAKPTLSSSSTSEIREESNGEKVYPGRVAQFSDQFYRSSNGIRECVSCGYSEEPCGDNVFEMMRPDDNVEVLFLPMADGSVPAFAQVKKFLFHADRHIGAGGKVIVHCQAGVGRTGIFLAAYLMEKYRCFPDEAIQMLRNVRPQSMQFHKTKWIEEPFTHHNPHEYARNFLQERFIMKYWKLFVADSTDEEMMVNAEMDFNTVFPPPDDCMEDIYGQLVNNLGSESEGSSEMDVDAVDDDLMDDSSDSTVLSTTRIPPTKTRRNGMATPTLQEAKPAISRDELIRIINDLVEDELTKKIEKYADAYNEAHPKSNQLGAIVEGDEEEAEYENVDVATAEYVDEDDDLTLLELRAKNQRQCNEWKCAACSGILSVGPSKIVPNAAWPASEDTPIQLLTDEKFVISDYQRRYSTLSLLSLVSQMNAAALQQNGNANEQELHSATTPRSSYPEDADFATMGNRRVSVVSLSLVPPSSSHNHSHAHTISPLEQGFPEHRRSIDSVGSHTRGRQNSFTIFSGINQNQQNQQQHMVSSTRINTNYYQQQHDDAGMVSPFSACSDMTSANLEFIVPRNPPPSPV